MPKYYSQMKDNTKNIFKKFCCFVDVGYTFNVDENLLPNEFT